MGMVALSLDEMVMINLHKAWVILIICSISVAVLGVWWDAVLMVDIESQSETILRLGTLIMGLICPVTVPFLFFHMRISMRRAIKDVLRLCELALPFMIVISLCMLIGTHSAGGFWEEGVGGVKETSSYPFTDLPVNITLFTETYARWALGGEKNNSSNALDSSLSQVYWAKQRIQEKFRQESVNKSNQMLYTKAGIDTPHFLAFCLTPIVAGAATLNLITAVSGSHATEFVASFTMVLAVRYGVTHYYSTASAISVGSAFLGFVLSLLVKGGGRPSRL
jgi:hypothetical protein